ncbi:MAG: 4Fe-4S dicluster domain-containing protein [Anaerolineales bacterium]
MRPVDPPPPEYAFGYRRLPESGNAINGLGVAEKTPARHVFHNATGETLPWNALDEFFSQINVWGVVRHMLANVWQLRRRDGPVAPTRIAVDDPLAMTAQIKARARELGAGLVGIAAVSADAVYAGHAAPYDTAICIGLPMRRDEMLHVPHEPAAIEVMRAYREVSRIAVELSEHIRGLGWPARAYGNPNSTDILHIPLALAAGLGQLGKHGSMISKEFGSNFRLAAVLTDLPLAPDDPVDIGVEDLCAVCHRCVWDCPPGAIYEEKQLVRGVKKWYVNFDKCIPYFVKTYGCAICIEVCPWSEPGRGPWLSEQLLARRV